MAQITWSPRAIKDIDEIATYIAKDSLQYAQAQTRLFFSTAAVLEKYPFKGRPVPELGRRGNRYSYDPSPVEASQQ
jgi:plasmid stabilization system protein ParE